MAFQELTYNRGPAEPYGIRASVSENGGRLVHSFAFGNGDPTLPVIAEGSRIGLLWGDKDDVGKALIVPGDRGIKTYRPNTKHPTLMARTTALPEWFCTYKLSRRDVEYKVTKDGILVTLPPEFVK